MSENLGSFEKELERLIDGRWVSGHAKASLMAFYSGDISEAHNAAVDEVIEAQREAKRKYMEQQNMYRNDDFADGIDCGIDVAKGVKHE